MKSKQIIQDILDTTDINKTQLVQELIQQSYFISGTQEIFHHLDKYIEKNKKEQLLTILFLYHSLFNNSFIETNSIDHNHFINRLNELNRFWNEYEDDKAFSLSISNYSQFLSLKTQLLLSFKSFNESSSSKPQLPSLYNDQVQIIMKLFSSFDSLISSLQNITKYNIKFAVFIYTYG